MSVIFRLFRYSFQDFYRNIWLSLVTITILVLAILSVNFLVIFNVLAKQAILTIEEKVDLGVYFKKEVEEQRILEIKSILEKDSSIKEVRYISSDEALTFFRKKHENDEKILNALEEVLKERGNPFGGSLVIKAKDIEGYKDILSLLNNKNIVPKDLIETKDFGDYETMIKRVEVIKKRVGQGGMVLTLIFIFIAVLIIINTLRINIYTHREEIGIMRLVGATNWFIRFPYLLESMFFALISVIVSIIIIYPLLGVIDPYIVSFFEDSRFSLLAYFQKNFFSIFALELLGAIILCLFSSLWAIGKYLKV